MPRLYLTPSELLEQPLGIALANQISSFNPGVIDRMLARCSARCDSYCEKRLQAPGSSTLSQIANAGTTSISVGSTLTLDDKDEQAVIIDPGTGIQEIVGIVPGGVAVTSWTGPYPGTLTLDAPLQFSHSQNAVVQYIYKEVREAIKASQSDPYSEALQSQAAQLALAHLPPMQVGLTRIVFTKSYPIQTIFTVEHAYSFDTQYNLIYNSANPVFNGTVIVEPAAGYFRFKVGTVVTPEGMVRVAYSGGFSVIPDDIKLAVTYYLADDLARMSNPYGAVSVRQGARSQSFQIQQGKTGNVEMAQEILDNFRRRT